MDETLLVDHHVPVINRQAIQKARESGVHVMPATGRSFPMIQDILAEMGTKGCQGEYSICFNGAAVYENNKSLPIYCDALNYSQVKTSYDTVYYKVIPRSMA